MIPIYSSHFPEQHHARGFAHKFSENRSELDCVCVCTHGEAVRNGLLCALIAVKGAHRRTEQARRTCRQTAARKSGESAGGAASVLAACVVAVVAGRSSAFAKTRLSLE